MGGRGKGRGKGGGGREEKREERERGLAPDDTLALNLEGRQVWVILAKAVEERGLFPAQCGLGGKEGSPANI